MISLPGSTNAEFIANFRRSVFVFGSNLQGIHGAGAARFARQYREAVLGVGEGPTGSCYALPTKATPHDEEQWKLSHLQPHVERFLDHARAHPDQYFQVTAVGCGLAGFSAADIAPLFRDAPENCWFPGLWEKLLRHPGMLRVIVAGGRTFADKSKAFAELDRTLDRALSGQRPVQVVSGRARGADTFGEEWALAHRNQLVAPLPYAPFPSQWERFGKAAGFMRNQEMSWYGTHLIAFWDGFSRGTKNMIETAKRDGLHIKIVEI
ncbi:A1S_2505 family phage non-structural protein [Thiomonas sp.]